LDLAIITENGSTGNELKTTIRAIEKEITQGLSEIIVDGVTSKGSRFRKSVFKYEPTEKGNANNKLIVEVNSFANPFPYAPLTIGSFVFDFLNEVGNEKYIGEYGLHPFKINVLSIEQTLLEKIVSLIRFSFDVHFIERISSRVRHFYDLYFLANHVDCKEFISSKAFKTQFDAILNHDRVLFDQPIGWRVKTVAESPLITDFETVWNRIEAKYQSELSALAYRSIPNEEAVSHTFIKLSKRIL